jgi:hypothetical protein
MKPVQPLTRLTLTFSAAPSAARLATIGASLAAQLGVELDAMLFEDSTLLRLAESRLLRRVRVPSGESEAPSAIDLAREMQLHEARLRHAVVTAARSAGIASSFRVVPDDRSEAPFAACGEVVIVSQDGLLGHRHDVVRRLLGRVTGLLMLPSAPELMPAPLSRAAVLVGTTPRAAFLAAAFDFARRVNRGREVDLVSSDAGGEMALQAARAALAGSAMDLRLHRLAATALLEPGSETLPSVIDALIMSMADLPRDDGAIEAMLSRLRRPLLLVRDDASGVTTR